MMCLNGITLEIPEHQAQGLQEEILVLRWLQTPIQAQSALMLAIAALLRVWRLELLVRTTGDDAKPLQATSNRRVSRAYSRPCDNLLRLLTQYSCTGS